MKESVTSTTFWTLYSFISLEVLDLINVGLGGDCHIGERLPNERHKAVTSFFQLLQLCRPGRGGDIPEDLEEIKKITYIFL